MPKPSESINDFDAIADVYDQLVSWAPYGRWVRDLVRRLRRHGLRKRHLILDAACGTGLSTIALARLGYRVVGVDRSERMLRQARRKLDGTNLRITFHRQDLLGLDLSAAFDAAVCMHSGLDYLGTAEEFTRALRSLRSQLRQGALLAFDKCLHRPGFYRKAYTNSREIPCGTAIFHYSWDEKRRLFDQRCVVLRRGADGVETRTEVLHRMRAFAPDELAEMAGAAGFEVIEPVRQFTVEDPGMGIFRAV